MNALKIIALVFIAVYFGVIIILYALQAKFIFYPGKLPPDYSFKLGAHDREIFLSTADGQRINALFFPGSGEEVILYFHGNAGDMSGWQFVAEDFTSLGYNFLILDYRGYGKSSGAITEAGLYRDGEAGYQFLLQSGFTPKRILVYGRSIGSGVAVELASKHPCKGLILEAPYSSLTTLADEKMPLFFPSLYMKFRFDNLSKINKVTCPVIFLHGDNDSLIPDSHSTKLFEKFRGKKKMVTIINGSHNDLITSREYQEFLNMDLRSFF